jgi:hypothetical protein
MHIPGIGNGELRSRRGRPSPPPPPREGKGEPGPGVENCNREGVFRSTFPSLPTVCSFRAATPYLQVQCLLSLIHIPWPTHPYYPLALHRTPHPLLYKVYLPTPCLAESHSRILFVPFRSLYTHGHACMYVCAMHRRRVRS